MLRFRSVVARTIALHLVAIIATSILMPLALYLMLQHAAQSLHDRALREQAGEILQHIDTAPDGALRLNLPTSLAEIYSEAYGRYAFAVLDIEGTVLFSSLSNHRAVSRSVRRGEDPVYFSERRGSSNIYGVSLPVDAAGRPLTIQVSQDLAHRDVLIDDIVADFFTRVSWVTAPILLLLLIIDVLIIRRAVRPVVAASTLAEMIDPSHTDLRLPEAGMPREIQPLVHAVNQALDRLEDGFRGQREFTADAAHELRTPLAILRTQVDMMADRETALGLRHDIDNMSRLVNQLLEMSELDTFVIGRGEIADLRALSAEVAGFLAPLALTQNKRLGVTGARSPVLIRGNADMIARAVRNLIENALVHTPARTTVDIGVDPSGAITVSDHGPGVPAADRNHIFRRFWRRDRRRQGSAGLGLSIVARIAERHGGTVTVGDRPGGGAVFTLKFPMILAAAETPAAELAAAK